MTTPATSIFSKVLYVPETTFNQLPVSPTMTDVPFVDCSLALDITKVVDNSIQGDTMHRYVLPTTQKVAGTISGEVSHKNMDWIFQAVSYNVFTSNVVTTGTSQNTFSIEVGSSDINQYFLYTGCVIDKLALTVAPAGLVTYKADFIGAGSTVGTSTNATVTNPAPQNPPMTAVTATIKEGNTAVATITGGSFSFDRKHTVNYALGNAQPVSLSTSFFDVTGTLDIFLEDEVLYNKFVNSSNSSIDWTFTDGTNTYEMILPQVVYTTFAKDVKGTGPIMCKCNFTAVRSPVSNTNFQVTRSS
jgi:Phage tail tube protein